VKKSQKAIKVTRAGHRKVDKWASHTTSAKALEHTVSNGSAGFTVILLR